VWWHCVESSINGVCVCGLLWWLTIVVVVLMADYCVICDSSMTIVLLLCTIVCAVMPNCVWSIDNVLLTLYCVLLLLLWCVKLLCGWLCVVVIVIVAVIVCVTAGSVVLLTMWNTLKWQLWYCYCVCGTLTGNVTIVLLLCDVMIKHC